MSTLHDLLVAAIGLLVAAIGLGPLPFKITVGRMLSSSGFESDATALIISHYCLMYDLHPTASLLFADLLLTCPHLCLTCPHLCLQAAAKLITEVAADAASNKQEKDYNDCGNSAS